MIKTSGKHTLRGLATVNFYAADVKAAKKWYTEMLNIEPYFERPDSKNPAYIEFRIGDYQHELGIIDSKYAPTGAAAGPGGTVVYWHVDDVASTLEKVTAMERKNMNHSQNVVKWDSLLLLWSTLSATSLALCITLTS